jgi:hypothetical protein
MILHIHCKDGEVVPETQDAVPTQRVTYEAVGNTVCISTTSQSAITTPYAELDSGAIRL